MVNTMLKVGLPHNTEYDGDRPESPDKLAASQALMFNKRPIYEQYASPAHSAPSKLNTRQHRDVPLDSKLIPTGNSVLRLFGEWLFDYWDPLPQGNPVKLLKALLCRSGSSL